MVESFEITIVMDDSPSGGNERGRSVTVEYSDADSSIDMDFVLLSLAILCRMTGAQDSFRHTGFGNDQIEIPALLCRLFFRSDNRTRLMALLQGSTTADGTQKYGQKE